jgi:hypothetical protein
MSLLQRFLPTVRASFVLSAAIALEQPTHTRGDEPEEEGKTVTVDPLKTDIFRDALFRKEVKALRNVAEVGYDPEHTIIILLGEKSLRLLDYWDVNDAVRRGAALLVASDQSSAGTRLSALVGVEISGELVDAEANDCYRGRPYYPFVIPFKAWRQIDKSSPRTIFQALDSSGPGALVTNNASVLHLRKNHFARPEPLAGYPLSAHRPNRVDDKFDPDNDYFAAGGQLGEGRYLVLADHSIFLNSMVWRPEVNSNLFFMQDCISWLQGEEKKNRCLFIEDGEVKTEFKLNVPDEELSDWQKFMLAKNIIEKHGNEILTELQQRDSFNDVLTRFVGYRPILRFFIVAFTAFIVLFGLLMLVRGRTGPDPARTLVSPELAAMIPRGNVLRQRFDAQLDVENVYEAARHLVRDFLGGLDAEPDANGLPPQLIVEDGYLDEAGLRRRIARLWRIGFDNVPVTVAPDDWSELTQDLHDVLADADDGWWKFVPNRTT